MKWIVFSIFLFLPTLFANEASLAHDSSLPKPSDHDCGFYLDLEKKLRCVEKANYLIDYGYPYCSKFQEKLKSWSEKRLVSWVPKTTLCLQEALIENPKRLTPCKLMEDWAFGTHPTCYIQAGFCSLKYSEQQRVFDVVAWSDIMGEFSESVAQTLRVKATCEISIPLTVLHFVDFLFGVTRHLDSEARKNAAELALHIPDDRVAAIRYSNAMYYAMVTGQKYSVAAASAGKNKLPLKAQYMDFQALALACKDSSQYKNFCSTFQKSNTRLYEPAMTAKGYVEQVLPRRLRDANKALSEPHQN